jgi:phage terminase large subunit-like protein
VSAVDARTRLDRLEELRRLEVAKLTNRPPRRLEPHQVAPPGQWYLWLLMAGRGAGKTEACAAYFDKFMRTNPGFRGGIIGPTIGDVFQACIHGPSGLLAINPRVRLRSGGGGTEARWTNGSVAALFGTHSLDDVNRLRAGGNRHIYWCEELAAWRYLQEAWQEGLDYGLRLGTWPHAIASTTPKTRPFLKALMADPETIVTRASTFDNPHLPDAQKERLRVRYQDTRLGRQELYGEYIDEVEGALWTLDTLLKCHVDPADEKVPDMRRVVVAVDPSGGDSEGNDEQGIVVAGHGVDGDFYVLADRSCKLSPDGWGRRTVAAYDEFKADVIAWEANFGGEMVAATVKVAAQAMEVYVNTKKVTASRGKVARAEPIAALYEQGRVHHVAPKDEPFEEMEEQMRTWTPDTGWSPDRMDALVWALTELSAGPQPVPMRTYRTQARIPTGDDRFGIGIGI